jgi:hypothetical protein
MKKAYLMSYCAAAAVLSAFLILPSLAQGYDTSSFVNGAPDRNRAPQNENPGEMFAASPYGAQTATQGDTGVKTIDAQKTGEQFDQFGNLKQYVVGRRFDPATGQWVPILGKTNKQTPACINADLKATTKLIAPLSTVGKPTAIPSGSFNYGFPSLGAKTYKGVDASKTGGGNGGSLPPTSTGSVDINIVE